MPCILRWPGRIAAGRSQIFPVNHCDLFQTVLSAARVQEPAEAAAKRNAPGRSCRSPLAEGGTEKGWRGAATISPRHCTCSMYR